MQTPHLTTSTTLHAFRGSDYNSNNNFGEDDDDVDEDDEPPKLDTSPQEFLYRMQQRESQNKSSDSTSDDSSTTNDSILSAPSYGPGRGRSTPQIRSAFGAKKNKQSSLSNNIKRGAKGGNDTSKDTTTVHVCTNCGAEYIQWRGQCSTCLEWNTIQEYTARRKPSSSSGSGSKMKPIFGKQQQGKFSNQKNSVNSWLDGIDDYSYNPGGGGSSGGPVRVTDVYQEILSDTDDESLDAFQNNGNNRERRTLVPDDSELNTVLGGGIMPGSICLVGGDPGVFLYNWFCL